MQLITAIIQPFMLDRLCRVLRKENLSGYTVTAVKGSGRELSGSPEYLRDRVKVEIAVVDELVDSTVEIILSAVGTHQQGDGVIFVTPIFQVVNIQTRERGDRALNRPEDQDG